MDINSEKTVYFVRHGQSVDNALPVYQSINSPLSDKGNVQAKAIAERLQHVPFDALIASPVLRAKQTAEHISDATGMPVTFSDLFVERSKPTSIDGKSWDDATARQVWDAWEESLHKPNLRVEDGENYEDIIRRADAALTYLQHSSEQHITVVTHGYFLRAIIAKILLGDDITPQSLERCVHHTSVENTAITVIHFKPIYAHKPAWRIWTLNDHSHFAE